MVSCPDIVRTGPAPGLGIRTSAGQDPGSPRRDGQPVMKRALWLFGICLLGLISLIGTVAAVFPSASQSAPSSEAVEGIPVDMLRFYQAAAQTCPGLPWTVLAAIGKIESNHGRSTLPGVRSGENYAGAGGPMQFLAGTWAAYGVDADGDGIADRYNPADAVYGAANYLCASGAGKPGRLRQAIFAYNHADWYVNEVLAQAARYSASVAQSAGTETPADSPRR